jgi:hypothetical protein
VALWNIAGGYLGYGSALVMLSTDTDNELCCKPLYSGNVEVITSMFFSTHRERRFHKGEVLYYAKSAGADTAVIVTCIR